MSQPNRDRDQENSIRWDDWPIERSDRQEVDREGGTGASTADDYVSDDDYEWVGVNARTGEPWIVEPHEHSLYRGEADEESERIVVDEDSRREFDSRESLGERIEEIGDEHGWERLSAFAERYLDGDDDREAKDASSDLQLRQTEFEERNVADSADHDLSYTGSHTLADRSGRVHVVERRFDIRDEGDRANVSVQEDFLVAEEPREEDRAGDADLVAQREDEFDVGVDSTRDDWETQLREELQEWHESNVEWRDA